MATFTGVITIFAEQGSGSAWAFQDERYMRIADSSEVCKICRLRKDYIDQQEDEGLFAGIKIKFCRIGEHAWVKAFPDGKWSYEGLHVLKPGDELIIYEPNSKTVCWRGTIQLRLNDEYDAEEYGTSAAINALTVTDQVGVDREVWSQWFIEHRPAKLETAN